MSWQPIETAPDNVPLLVAIEWPIGVKLYVATKVSFGNVEEFLWEIEGEAADWSPDRDPTHWMPLPEPPEGTGV